MFHQKPESTQPVVVPKLGDLGGTFDNIVSKLCCDNVGALNVTLIRSPKNNI